MFKGIVTFVFIGVCILAIQNVCASPADPNPVKIKQPDGTEITIKLKGDENVKWMESMDGYSLLYGKDKYIVYAVQDEKGDMVPSEVVFQDVALRSADLSEFKGTIKKGLRYSSSQIRMFREISEMEQQALSVALLPKLRATTGQAKAICALIGFPDKPFTHTVDEFEQLMNQVGYSANGARGSVRDFYLENSYGKLELIVTVVGPYTASKDWKYYGGNDGTTQKDKNVRELAQEAANFAFTGLSVNPADYDNDGDGTIDTFHFLYAGYGEEAGGGTDCIWAHKSGYSPALTFGSKRLSIYSCSPELKSNSGDNITNIGVICHELCHVFGAPDYYDTNDATGGEFVGTGNWDLMAGGSWNYNGISPAHINMYQKIVFGWVTPTELNSETSVSGMLNSAENPVAYKVNTTTSGEYFILENRQKAGFDSYLPGSGLLIYRVSAKASGNSVSNATHPQQVYPVCASSSVSMPYLDPASYGSINSGGCPFPGSSGNEAFTDYSTPSAKSWDGNNTSKPITEIKEENKLISFSFMKSGATVENLRTSVNEQDVTISWDLPQGAVPDKYAIYRNDQTLIILNDGSAQSYTQHGVSAGTYTYCVAPIYGVSESTKQCASIQVTGHKIDCSPIKNLSAISKGNSISLSWNSAFDGGWINHANEIKYTRGYTNQRKFTYVSRWTTEDLKDMRGSTLTKIRFFASTASCEYTIKVWAVSPEAEDPTLITEQKVTSFTASSMMDVALINPVVIEDNDNEYWMGIECNITATVITGIYPAASDAGPAAPSRNLVYIDKWYSVSDFNWYLGGFLEAPELKSSVATWLGRAPETKFEIADLPVESNPIDMHFSNADELRSTKSVLSGFKIYRDGKLIENVKARSFTDENVPQGGHVYCVSAVYGDCESEQVCVAANSTQPVNPYSPVNQLLADVNQRTVSLSWTKPQEKGGQIAYSSNTYGGTIGNKTATLDIDIAIRFAAGDLTTQNGTQLTKVKFIPGNTTSTYSIRIWQGGNSVAAGRLLMDQPVTPIKAREWQEVVLNTPVKLDIYEELWIGVHCISAAGEYAASFDDTQAVAGKGNLVYSGGKWGQASDLNASFTNNWCIAGILEFPYTLSGYKIYRDNQVVGNTNNLNFTETLANNGTYIYGVSALYGENESDKSNTIVVINFAGKDKILSDNLVNIFPNPVTRGGILTIDLGIENTSAELLFFNISGQVVKKEFLKSQKSQCRVDLPSGTYLMQVRLGSGKIKTLKIIVN